LPILRRVEGQEVEQRSYNGDKRRRSLPVGERGLKEKGKLLANLIPSEKGETEIYSHMRYCCGWRERIWEGKGAFVIPVTSKKTAGGATA